MKYNELGQSGIKVSELCLGTMTWGSQNSQEDANRQIDISLDHGINFLDTAEMYPTTPRSSKSQGDTERIIGNWLKSNNRRSNIISYHFRQNWNYDPFNQDTNKEIDDIFELLNELNNLFKEGKIRTIGLSNETSWGTMKFLSIAKENNFPKIVSIQNEYSLLCRHFDLDLAEVCHHEKIGLLSFSPIACGILSGKYLNGNIPKGSRKSIYNDLGNRHSNTMEKASQEYINLSQKFNLNSSQMALAFCLQRPFMTSVIFGATTENQLLNNIKSIEVKLEENQMNEITKIYKKFPIPF